MTPCQGMASPCHLQPRPTTTATTTVRMHRKARNREHLRAFSFYFRTSKYCSLTPPFACYKRRGRDPRQKDGGTTPHNGNVLSTHSNTRTHPHTETWELSLSRPTYILLLQALGCKATRAAVSTRSRDVQPELVYILCPPCTPSEVPTRNIIHLSPSLDTPF
jgi:hypothetical protein